MGSPEASYTITDFFFNGIFHTVEKSSEPFWTMPTPELMK